MIIENKITYNNYYTSPLTVYGWVHNVSMDFTSAEPQPREITAMEGDEITLTLFFTKNNPVNFNAFLFDIQTGGSATGIRLINLPAGLTPVTDAGAKTVTITGIPASTGFVRVETEGTSCEIIRLDHNIVVTNAPERPDYILIDNAPGGTDPIPIITGQDGSIYNGQVYLCEQALASSPSPTLFTACYNDGRIAPLTESYIWFISPSGAGSITATTGSVTWNDGLLHFWHSIEED